MLRGMMPSGELFPPRVGLSASLSPAWSFIIYGGDKIKQTQQNGVKSESCSSHMLRLPPLSTQKRGADRDARGSEFAEVPSSASQHPSAASSQVESLALNNKSAAQFVRTGSVGDANVVISQVIKAKFTLSVLRLFSHMEVADYRGSISITVALLRCLYVCEKEGLGFVPINHK